MKTFLFLFVFFISSTSYSQSLLNTSRGNKFNPAIGLNALTLYQNNSRTSEEDGFALQEIELQFSSDVDAYFRAEATIGLHQEEEEEEEGEGEGEEEAHGHEFKV